MPAVVAFDLPTRQVRMPRGSPHGLLHAGPFAFTMVCQRDPPSMPRGKKINASVVRPSIAERAAAERAVRGRSSISMADVSKPGRAALEPMRDLGLHPVLLDVVWIIGGRGAKRSFEVGQAELADTITIMSAERRIKDAVGDPVFAEQLRAARTKSDNTDLERALSCALWWGEMRWRCQLPQPRPPINALRAAIAKACEPPTWDQMMAAQRVSGTTCR